MEKSRASRDFFPRKGNTASEGVKSVVNSYSVHDDDDDDDDGDVEKEEKRDGIFIARLPVFGF